MGLFRGKSLQPSLWVGNLTFWSRSLGPSRVHLGKISEDLSSAGGKWVHVEALPGYSPDLTPWDRGGWHHLKHVEMRNVSCMDLEELHLELHLAIGRLRQKPHLIHGFFANAGLSL